MRTINQDTVNSFYLFRNQKYSRILKEAQKTRAKLERKIKQEKQLENQQKYALTFAFRQREEIQIDFLVERIVNKWQSEMEKIRST